MCIKAFSLVEAVLAIEAELVAYIGNAYDAIGVPEAAKAAAASNLASASCITSLVAAVHVIKALV